MRSEFVLLPVFLLTWLPATGQQNTPAILPAGAGPAAPVLLPPILTVSTPKRCDELDGVVKLGATIDAAGLPQALKTLDSTDRRLVGFATELVEAQRFKPGTIDGSNTAVDVELTVALHTCAQREKHPTDGNFYRFMLRAHPQILVAVAAPPAAQQIASTPSSENASAEQVGGRISAPILTVLTDPQIPISRRLPRLGLCLLGVTVDTNGVPQNIRVFRSLDPELDSNVVEAARNWRFKPALRDGSAPVAIAGTVAAAFGYIEKEPVVFATFIPEIPEKTQARIARHDIMRPRLEALNADEVIARYMPQSRISGRCLVSLVIDTDGVPRNVHVIKGLDSSLDMETVAMVEHLRFKPVMQDGTTPVPVGLIMPVHYRGTIDKVTWKDLLTSSLSLAVLLFL